MLSPEMPIEPGSLLGPYEILSPLGAGGMGEVYRARDTRLGRDVAIKVLLPDVSENPERRARFEREARTVASLNHPTILALYDIGQADSRIYIVTELVEGGLLRDRIAAGPMPARELLDLAVQIADGLAAAHSAGITHRDLKPENVMLTRDGRAKILDFGLARQVSQAAAADSPHTLTMTGTLPGAVMGTPNYMSPEQAQGLAVDHRSDQFSFGIILYEMATGKQPFARNSAVQTMSAVITDDAPAIDPALQAKLPVPLRWTIDRCLAKDPGRRYESTRDLHADLRNQREHIGETISSAHAVVPEPAKPILRPPDAPRPIWQLVTAVLLIAVAALGYLLFRRRDRLDLAQFRFTPFAVAPEGQGSVAWSPDGKAAAYLVNVAGYQVFLRSRNASLPRQLTTPEISGYGISGLYGFSPDGKRIYFRSRNPGGKNPEYGLFSISTTGGEPKFIAAFDATTADLSRDANTFVIYRQDSDAYRRVYYASPPGSPFRPYPSEKFSTQSKSNMPRMRFSPDGKKLLFLLNNGKNETRWLLPFPPGTGEPHEVLSQLPRTGFTPMFSWFPDSRHVAISFPVRAEEPENLWIADVKGKDLRRLTASPQEQAFPVVSPDGRSILYQGLHSDLNIASISLADATPRMLLATERDEFLPAYAPGTSCFSFITNRNGPPEIWIHHDDESDRPLVTAADFPGAQIQFFMNPTLTPSTDRVIYSIGSDQAFAQMWISPTAGGQPVRVTNSTSGLEFPASISPDGKHLAYLAIDQGKIHLQLVNTSGEATPVNLASGIDDGLPQWSPAGDWLTYRQSGWHLISPDGKTVRDLGDLNTRHLAFSPDGKKLYGIRSEKGKNYLFTIPAIGGKPADIGEIAKEFAPASPLNPGFRLSVAADGKTAIYTVAIYKSNIWLLEGFEPPGRFW